MPKTAGELQEQVQELLADVEALARHPGGGVQAEPLLRELEELAARLERYHPQQVPPASLELQVRLERLRARVAGERAYLRWLETRPVGRMVAYQLLWLASMTLLVFSWWNYQERWGGRLPREVEVLIGCMLWGAAGSAFSSIIAMVRHKAGRTLLPEYETWHLMKPLVGGFVGCLVYLILAGGIHFFNPGEGGVPGTAYGVFAAVADRAYLAYLLSALMGFQERSFFTKVELLIKALLGLGGTAPGPPAHLPCYPPGAPGTHCPCCCHSPGSRAPQPPDPPGWE